MDTFRNRIAQYVDAPMAERIVKTLTELDTEERTDGPGAELVRAGTRPNRLFVMLDGWAVRYRLLCDGRRQIVNFMLPGDLFDLQVLGDLEADHSVATLTQATFLCVGATGFLQALREAGDLASAFWWAAVQEESMLREHIVRVGQLSARERIGHLFLELRRRLSAARGGAVNDVGLPLTRTDLADMLGLTPVHISRTLSAMKRDGLIEENHRTIAITDRARLARLSQFDDSYLHVRRLVFTD